MSKSKFKALSWTVAGVVLGMMVYTFLRDWGINNDIPLLQDL